MPLLPIFGHDTLRKRLLDSLAHNTLPQSLLLHGAPRVGKQRLALWLAQVLLCDAEEKPCGACPQCRKVLDLNHKDLLWIFPQMRAKDSDITPEEAADNIAKAAHDRGQEFGLYDAPSGMEGIHIPAMRAAVKHAVMTPALAKRKVIVVGDADRMISQEGSDQAANAFLKLLEEPPADTFVILTSSSPGKLLPTIRSRVVAVRVAPVSDDVVTAWMRYVESQKADKEKKALSALVLPANDRVAIGVASGAIGRLLDSQNRASSTDTAKRFIEVARKGDHQRAASLALSQTGWGARGGFTETLDALVEELIDQVRSAVEAGDEATARGAAVAVDLVEEAKTRAYGNNNPQLIASNLISEMTRLLRV
jgi:DNA polymerase-3 subunit delta'